MGMISFFGIARSALLTHQKALDVTAHNVANALTPGYSRQRVDLSSMVHQTPTGVVGRGVDVAGISRVRSSLLDQTYRTESGLFGQAQTLNAFLSGIEAAFQEPSEQGLGAALDGLYNAFSELANDPASPSARSLVRQAGDSIARRFRDLDARLTEVQAQTSDQTRVTVDRINQLSADVSNLNGQIRVATAGGGSAPDLEDRRDALLDELSGLAAITVQTRTDGSVAVATGNGLLVDANQARTLEVRAAAGGIEVGFVSGPPISPRAGEIAGLLQLSNTDLPALQSQLDTLAGALVTELNAVHRTGFNATGATNVDFFDPAGTTAGTIALSAAVTAGVDAIATGATAAAGDGNVALQIAALRTAAVGTLGGRSVGDFYNQMVTTLGGDVRQASTETTASQALVDRAQAVRAGVSGVSVDEEVVAMINQQHAFSAAARLVTVADEMIQDLLRMV